ncbi:porin [Fuscovulum ytuae]|uniref:Porin n=1 Tax=Fuscovulum ytuae TaxID=3042299 RepID=A0ABY8Q404_9RHOB|nr:porin [Fuscovulum sp. YMD61]WGV15326.1 porin [Fuscovulum sp. YMD61]
MKKILLATTMLAGTAGFAAAEVAISGYAEVGIYNSDTAATGAGSTQFWTDVDVTFKMSGETDGGLAFGVSVDLDEAGNLGNSLDNNGTSVFVSGAFGKLTVGDTDGALDWAVADAGSLTAIADDHTTHAGYFGAGGLDGTYDDQVARYEYSFGSFGIALSLEQEDNAAANWAANSDPVWGVGATYAMDMGGTALRFGLGYQSTTVAGVDSDAIGASISAEFAGGFSGVIGFTNTETGGVDTDRLGIGATYTTGALSIHANYGEIDTAGVSNDSYGLAVNYDLGGGAVVMAGYGSDTDFATAGNQSTYSIGLGLSF